MQLFYSRDIDNNSSNYTFNVEESKHIVKVLRKKEGDILRITDGQGQLFEVQIAIADSKKCQVEIISCQKEHRPMHSLHIAVAPTKMNDRFEWFLEKATEIGIDEITPIICERSERKIIKPERLEKVIQSAMKQSLRTYLPKLNAPIPFKDFLTRPPEGLLFIAHCEEDEKKEFKRSIAPDKDITIMIGPEGDFSPNEITKAREKQFVPVSLGKSRLRTETAAIVACTMVAMVNDW